MFLLRSQVTLGVKKLCRRAYGRTINILQLPFAVRPGHVVVHQTPSNGSLIDSAIIYAPLMRLTPVYWLLFVCCVTFFNCKHPPTYTHTLFPSQMETIKQYRDTENTWPLWMASPQWRKKNSLRISGQTWVYICIYACVFLYGWVQEIPQSAAGTNRPTGAAVAVCLLWQQDEINDERKSINIGLAL